MWQTVDYKGNTVKWYEESLIRKIQDYCVEAQNNTGALIFKMIEEDEK